MKESMTYVCDNDSQCIVNTVSVRSEGYHNSVNRPCGVLNTNCVSEADQVVVKEDNAASQVGTLALHEEEEGSHSWSGAGK